MIGDEIKPARSIAEISQRYYDRYVKQFEFELPELIVRREVLAEAERAGIINGHEADALQYVMLPRCDDFCSCPTCQEKKDKKDRELRKMREGSIIDILGATHNNRTCSDMGFKEQRRHESANVFLAHELEVEALTSARTLPLEKCECGAHTIGFTEQGPGHSSWCKLWRKM